MIVAQNLISKSIRNQFKNYFPDPEKLKKKKEANPYLEIIEWFSNGNEVNILNDCSEKEYTTALNEVPGLADVVKKLHPKISANEKYLLMEFLLHGLSEFSLLSKNNLVKGLRFKDLFSSVFNNEKDS